MKKVFTLVCSMLLGATLSFAQAGGGSTGDKQAPATTTKAKKHHGKKGHHKGKKNDAGANTGTTPPK